MNNIVFNMVKVKTIFYSFPSFLAFKVNKSKKTKNFAHFMVIVNISGGPASIKLKYWYCGPITIWQNLPGARFFFFKITPP